jgi:hypothetical protein
VDAGGSGVATAEDGATQVTLSRGPAMVMVWKPPGERFELDPRAETSDSPSQTNHLFADLLVPVGLELEERAAVGTVVPPFVFVTELKARGVQRSRTAAAHFFSIGDGYHHDDVLRALAPTLREHGLALSDWGGWAARLPDIAEVFKPIRPVHDRDAG